MTDERFEIHMSDRALRATFLQVGRGCLLGPAA